MAYLHAYIYTSLYINIGKNDMQDMPFYTIKDFWSVTNLIFCEKNH